MNKKLATIAVAIIAIVSIVAYSYFVSANAKGTIKISGAFALYPLMVTWADEYQKIHPDVNIEVSAGGAGKGMTDALSRLVDIGMVSRDILPEEIANGAFFVKVTKDAVVATVSKNNPVLNDVLTKGITKQTFYNIFIAGNVTTWGQAVGKSNITDAIHVYTRSDSCGAADVWAKYLGKTQENLLGTGVYGDPGLLDAVKNDPLGIGFNNLGYTYDLQTKNEVEGIKVIPIDKNNNGQIDPEEDFYTTSDKIVQAILQGVYPSPPARNEHLVTKDAFTGLAKDFVKWILTDGQAYVAEVGYVPLPQTELDAQLAKLG